MQMQHAFKAFRYLECTLGVQKLGWEVGGWGDKLASVVNHFSACPPHSVKVSSHTEGIQLQITEKAMAQKESQDS